MSDLPGRPSLLIYGVWACLSLLVVIGNLHYLRTVWDYEWNASFQRAEVAAELTEQALLRAADGVGSVLDFAQTRVELAGEGAIEATAALDRRLQEIIAEQRFGIRGIVSMRTDGIINWTPSGEMMGAAVTERDYFTAMAQAGARHMQVSAPFLSRISGQWLITAARSIHDGQDRVSSLVAVAFDPMHLSRLLGTAAGRPGRALVVRQISDGRVRAASHDTQAKLELGAAPSHPVVQAARQAAAGRLDHLFSRRERPVLTAFRALPAHDLVVYAAFDQEAEMAPYGRIARPVMAAAILYVLCSLMMAFAWDRNARLRNRLHELATLDPLTGLHNRRALEERVAQMLPGAARAPEGFACLLFDIDHFKSINDRFGHARGDEVLREVARLLRSEVRGGDIVCRWGGEEMLVVLRRCDRKKALIRAEALRAAIEEMYASDRRITASVGVACFPGDGDTLLAMTGVADEALYRAKRAGRNRVAMRETALAA